MKFPDFHPNLTVENISSTGSSFSFSCSILAIDHTNKSSDE
jgi:hypothetical protein